MEGTVEGIREVWRAYGVGCWVTALSGGYCRGEGPCYIVFVAWAVLCQGVVIASAASCVGGPCFLGEGGGAV